MTRRPRSSQSSGTSRTSRCSTSVCRPPTPTRACAPRSSSGPSGPTWPLLILSQYVEERYAADLLASTTSSVGYLLKDRVADVDDFVESLRRVADGGTALDPEVVAQLLLRRDKSPLHRLTDRERETLSLMAEGRSNTGIARALHVSESAIAKHVNAIFTKLDMPTTSGDHRRVLAVLRYLSD